MNEVNASIITIGDELLIGQTVDTNSAYIARELNKIGIWVKRRIAIGDDQEEILTALAQQGQDCRVVIITGGLGPTADDITKPTLCTFFGAKLIVDEGALQNVKDIFGRLNRPLIERNLRQAEVPDKCIVLPNQRGTAPGMWFGPEGSSAEQQTVYISLPGVPHEMKGLMNDSVIPRLKETFPLPVVLHRTLLTAGIGESMLADAIAVFENSLPAGVKLAYLPAYGMVRLRLTARGSQLHLVETELDELFSQLKSQVEEWMIADEDISIQEALIRLLKANNHTVATAESCTGGYIAHLITSVSGSSAVYKGSIVSYANEAKEKLLFVQSNALEQYGAVSEPTVVEMVRGTLRQLNTDFAIATSGIMGPDGGTPDKPVGTVWIAAGNKDRIRTYKAHFRFDRARNIELTAHTALTMLFRQVKDREYQ